MIMEATINVEYQGKRYWVNQHYWECNDERIVLRMENGDAWDKSLTKKSDGDCNYVLKSEVKLWQEPVLFDNSDQYKPVLYKGKKFYILKAFSDEPSLLLCPDTDGYSGIDFVDKAKIHEYFDLVPVKWQGSKKTYYVRADRWNGLLYSWITLRNKNGVPYVTDNNYKPVKDKTNSHRWFYASKDDLKKVDQIKDPSVIE